MMTGETPKKKKVQSRPRKPKKDAEGREILVRKRPRKSSQLLSPTGMPTQPPMMQDPVQIEASIEQVCTEVTYIVGEPTTLVEPIIQFDCSNLIFHLVVQLTWACP